MLHYHTAESHFPSSLYSRQFPQVVDDSIVLSKSFEIDPISSISGEYSPADNHSQVESANALGPSGGSVLSQVPWRPRCWAVVRLSIWEGARHSVSDTT